MESFRDLVAMETVGRLSSSFLARVEGDGEYEFLVCSGCDKCTVVEDFFKSIGAFVEESFFF